jgi:hypothetical protein
MLKVRKAAANSPWVFPGESPDAPILVSPLDHQHDDVRAAVKLPPDFVLHSLRHTMLTRLGESGADAFTIMRIAGHSSVTVSQRYVHPTPEGLERSLDRLEPLNRVKCGQAEEDFQAQATGSDFLQKSLQSKISGPRKSPQVVEFKREGA